MKPTQTPGSEAGASGAVLDLCAQVLPVWARHLEHTRCQSETAVTDMLSAFAELAPHLDQEALKLPVERLYRGFQYQDRLNQLMTLLHDDMQRLLLALQQADFAPDAAQWLARLQASYVMAEQHQLHNGATPTRAASDADDTTFF